MARASSWTWDLITCELLLTLLPALASGADAAVEGQRPGRAGVTLLRGFARAFYRV